MSNSIELTYFAEVIPAEEGGFIVKFRDFDNIFSEGDSLEEALFNASEALDGVLLEMVQQDNFIPSPSNSKKEEYPVSVSPNIAAPILLHILRHKLGRSMTQVAQTMNVPYQQYQRLEHNSNMTLKTLKKAANAMGARVEIKFHLND